MRAVVMNAPGGPEVLQSVELPLPEITAPTHVRVRLHAAGVNPVDTKLRGKGTYFPDRQPTTLGCDGAGVVDAVWSGVTRVKPGDEVYFMHGGIGADPGCYAEYVVVDERYLAPKPPSLDFAEAAALPLALITAWEALHDRAGLRSGQRVLIHAGAGGVGHLAIQLAKAAECQVITTVSSPEKAQLARELGADEVVLYPERDFVEAVLAWSEGAGVDVALDTVGGSVFSQSFAAVRPYGDLVTLLQPAADTDWKIARMRNLRISLELMLSPMYYGWEDLREHQTGILETASSLITAGKLRPVITHRLPLEQAAEAHRLIEAGGITGKVVLLLE